MIKCLSRCDATLLYTYYTPLLLLQLLCNHVAVVISFSTNSISRVDRNKFIVIVSFSNDKNPRRILLKKVLCSAHSLFFFDFKVIGDYRSVALTMKFDTMTRSILIH